MSFGASSNSQALSDAIAYASAHGVLVTGAAGNSNQDAVMYPAGIQATLATSATDLYDHKASFSNYNYGIDISAPGSQLVAAYPGNRFAIVWGTSFAAPMAAAEGALTLGAWASQHSSPLSPAYLIRAIQYGADNISLLNPQYFGKLGAGRINMWKTYRLVFPQISLTTSATNTSSTSTTDPSVPPELPDPSTTSTAPTTVPTTASAPTTTISVVVSSTPPPTP